MEILGIGPMELILILIVALMVFGPDKLPQIGAKLGHAMRDMRKATRAISDEINSTRDAIEKPARELAEPFQEVAGIAKGASAIAAAARNPGAALRDSVLKELNAPAQSETPAVVEAGNEENRIAPPNADVPVSSEPISEEPVAALPEPEQPVAALPAPEESIAQLPASAESLKDSSEEPQPPALDTAPRQEEPPADAETPNDETSTPGTTALPPTFIPPEQ